MADPRGAYRSFLAERIAPALRQLGLRGSGVAFELPNERYWALVGFQADWRLARMGIVHFTVNLTVADKTAWQDARARKPYYPRRPPANSSFGMEAEAIRIGALIPVDVQSDDRWWTLDAEHPSGAVATAVIAAIRDHALPWLQGRVALASRDIPGH